MRRGRLHRSEVDAWNEAADRARQVAFDCGGEDIPEGDDATPADVKLVFLIERNEHRPDATAITISTRPLSGNWGPADTIGAYVVHRIDTPEWILP